MYKVVEVVQISSFVDLTFLISPQSFAYIFLDA